MKIQIKNYTFNKTSKTVTFTDYTSIDLDSILLITNVTTNQIIYNFAAIGGTVLNNVLTLNFDTSSMSNTDKLQIFYEDGQTSTDVINTTVDTFDNEVLWELRRMVKLMESNATVDIANRQRVAVETAVISSGTVTTVGTVSNLALIGGVDPRFTLIEQAKINYNTGVRSHLSFT